MSPAFQMFFSLKSRVFATIFALLTAPSVRIKYTFTDTKAEICFIELKWYWILLSFIISITMTIIKVIHFEWDTQKNTLVES